MSLRKVELVRNTKETKVSVLLDPDLKGDVSIETSVGFFNHMLQTLAFHGGFSLKVKASGDEEVDSHHLVEDVGLVMGELLFKVSSEFENVKRFAHSVIPMDEALSEVTIDVSGRPTLVLKADFPVEQIGSFEISLVREFLTALSSRARITLHAHANYGKNAHHMVESLFKALGKSIKEAYSIAEDLQSTKGTLTA
jgi:imidazoleglycerol-phosphate dehydratase